MPAHIPTFIAGNTIDVHCPICRCTVMASCCGRSSLARPHGTACTPCKWWAQSVFSRSSCLGLKRLVARLSSSIWRSGACPARPASALVLLRCAASRQALCLTSFARDSGTGHASELTVWHVAGYRSLKSWKSSMPRMRLKSKPSRSQWQATLRPQGAQFDCTCTTVLR